MKYLTIYKQLKADILAGKYSPNTKLPYLKQLGILYDSALGTLERAIRLLETEGLVVAIPSQGIYVRDPKALFIQPNFRKEKIRIAMLSRADPLDAMSAGFFRDIIGGITTSEWMQGGTIYPIFCHGKDILEIYKEINVLEINAIITVDFFDEGLRRAIETIKLPIVHADLADIGSKKPIITPNNQQGGEIALEKLYSLGHRSILYLGHHMQKQRKMDPMGMLRWLGASEKAKKLNFRDLRFETATYLESKTAEEVQAAIRKHSDCTGFIFGSMTCFHEAKSNLEHRTIKGRENIDAVIFSLQHGPESLDKKPVIFCRFNGNKMGNLAAKTLLDKSWSYPKIQYLPMFLESD
ncbi:MAG: hypothetical protein A2487_05940 [Candidatus Raymondbacteria bacterium RifOxyC12_full_50_8]|uniref:HTH gntR-type domain-containing protein n=1 Tax=Candidatus Raymondbacteria bacterium RIFOXYD12_FULL_49_13 TaxID=1817890 RepID=A0A1F7F3F9_UNCRA|nr:MAG: hypothetical protein A2248_10060 [Candidatus Raymondbacteria bacterium RIFOXYA2_FULL_49_16]OGJ86195.1 MAG: hypothetical protein A2350_18785 [Candidatus Raymondbacteria bacterium RifOxyB12_full_50_8]OGJ93558.1 MAG: hypothetical protein A2487_05940 [Candidatus Raymondbacteria bacterium RifOxyC12_full_50_8]OGK01103.1 MAG: hypothetical protein A2519_20310 [Candidatus Raymondbacteria bacterium RIFOXYD12_FULL_49_13]OGP39313.1 MAG: hypothetical protein A2324_02440 [Candidatus Raymondbacteria b